ncbi:hypothetical protein [Variovorax sp. JS1663]|uniref:hypothetical protein n=1 Tax=Variovorax sp. JS1663 TaxID=1851577 RepID=UPI000B347899|nr:hypothetical protein [Variovorax sp. JS1663]OUL98427.1 hypothetical protein A8M77_31495 [Variovorax sp. JS1663]
MDEDGEVKRFVYDDWDIRICLDAATADGQTSGHADLLLGGEHKCRISLSGRFAGADGACDTLERKARGWVDDWKSREHSGDTHFAAL